MDAIKKEVVSQAAKLVVGGGFGLIVVAGLGWWLYLQPFIVKLAGGVPKGAVIAFASENCPDETWSIYEKAYGKFIRGIDLDGDTDPDGLRAAGEIQGYATIKHNHHLNLANNGNPDGNGGTDANPNYIKDQARGNRVSYGTSYFGESEVRPVNVSLLYCIKN